MSKRVLILSASVGSGHKAAASAIEEMFRAHADVEVRNQDALQLTSRLYQVTASDMYFTLVKESPWFISWWYDQHDKPFRNEVGPLKLWNMINSQPLADFIREYDPDITVCTHFMPAGMVAQLLSQNKLRTTLSIVTTDYDFQGMWLSRIFNRYFVALEETKVHLAALGVDPARITVSGIPVGPRFSEPFDAAAVRAHYQLADTMPTLLVSAGALGGGPARDIVAQIMKMETPVQTVVVCGRNRALREEVIAQTSSCADRFRVLGFSDNIPDLMRVSTLFIGKPGGLTSAECMAASLPMVVIEPIPGQEERNSDHILEEGAGVRCRSLAALAYKLDRIFQEEGRVEALRAGTARLARRDAAAVVVDTLLNDDPEPLHLSEDEQAMIMALARGEAADVETSEELGLDSDVIALYDDETGVYLGTISTTQLATLKSELEEEAANVESYYLDTAMVEWLSDRRLDDDLLDLLRRSVSTRGYVELRHIALG